MVAYGYFMTGRYEDAARALARVPDESRVAQDYIEEASSLAALGRADEARPVVAKALARFPAISIERHISRPDFTEPERARYIATMRAAGFPACGREEDLRVSPSRTGCRSAEGLTAGEVRARRIWSCGRHDVGLGEVVALEEERLVPVPRKRVGEAVAIVEPGGMATPPEAPEGLGGKTGLGE